MTALGTIYTLEEAAAKLRLEKRTVAKLARKNGLCSLAGREYRFSDNDITAIWDAIRCPLQNSIETASGTSVARSSGRKFTSLQDFAMKKALSLNDKKKKLG